MNVGFDLGVSVRYFIQYAVTFIVIAWVLRLLAKNADKPAEKIEIAMDGSETKVLKSQAMKWVGLIDMILFTTLIILSSIFPGNTKNLLLVQFGFAFFALLGGYLLYMSSLTIRWSVDRLETYNLWGTKRIVLRWDEVEKITYHPNLMVFAFQLKNQGEKGWIPAAYYEGLFEFFNDLVLYCRHVPLENMTWDELEASMKEEPDWEELEVPKDHKE